MFMQKGKSNSKQYLPEANLSICDIMKEDTSAKRIWNKINWDSC